MNFTFEYPLFYVNYFGHLKLSVWFAIPFYYHTVIIGNNSIDEFCDLPENVITYVAMFELCVQYVKSLSRISV
jgi:hypothetical protein